MRDADYELEVALSDIIDRRVNQILETKGFETPYEANVYDIDEPEGNTNPYLQFALVNVIGYDASARLKNLSGELLATGDNVRIYTSMSNLSNGYIGLKFNV